MNPDELARALAIRDLTDPAAGEHAVQHVVAAIENALSAAWRIPIHHDPGLRVVSVADNYDRLRYDRAAVTRDRRYSRYVGPDRMLRAHTTARIPPLLDRLAEPEAVLSVPGICYRRDAIDPGHVGEPHQMDVWRIRRTGPPLTEADLMAMVGLVVEAVLPGRAWRTVPSVHPYTLAGREIYVDGVEVGECGLAHPEVIGTGTGLAMGLTRGRTRSGQRSGPGPDERLDAVQDPLEPEGELGVRVVGLVEHARVDHVGERGKLLRVDQLRQHPAVPGGRILHRGAGLPV